MKQDSNSAIGVFDSGLGGLTVVKELRKLMPNEDIIYLGDSARLPYGTKSKERIKEFSHSNASFLVEKGVKAVVIACNSSSANAYKSLRQKLDIPVIDVIHPACKAAAAVTENKKVAVIGTGATVASEAYQVNLKKVDDSIEVIAKSCPLFVSLVEEGWLDDEITALVIERYLKVISQSEADTLILGCTHYPLLRKLIAEYLGDAVNIVDSGPSAGFELHSLLKKNEMFSRRDRCGELKVFVSDLTEHFIRVGEIFLGENMHYVKQVEL